MRPLLILILSVWSSLGQAPNVSFAPFAIAFYGTNAAAGGGGGGGTLIHSETWNPTGTDLTWFKPSGSGGVDEDNTVWTGEGAQSFKMTNTTTFRYAMIDTSQRATNCVSFMTILDLNLGTVKFTLSESNVADRGYLFPKVASGQWTFTHGATEATSANAPIQIGSTNRFWIEYVNGTGSDGIVNVWHSTNSNTFPGGSATFSTTSGTSSTQPKCFTFQVGLNEAARWDYFRVWDSRPSNWDF